MLFDLRGRGRRRTIQGVYLFLALLLGGGLIFFGVGTGTNTGGLLNAVNQSTSSGDALNLYKANLVTARKDVARKPNDAAANLALAKAAYTLATSADYNQSTGVYTGAGKSLVTEMQGAWDKYLASKPAQPDVDTAGEVAQALIVDSQYTDAADAQQIVTLANPTSADQWVRLAAYAYYAGQTDKGDLAAAKALTLTPKLQQGQIKSQLATYKTDGQEVTAQQAETEAGITPGGGAKLPTG
jgi:predicted Zn-dependent protease